MGCGCGTGGGGGAGARAAKATVQTYQIEGDPNEVKYLTERDAIQDKESRELSGDVVPTL